jgi:MoaA/NifB/PqqE/SkfB family radical SAM enzyme
MRSKCITRDTSVGLEGGEFLLHPDAMEILQWFSTNHPNFDLLSNCLQPEKVIEAVKKYPPRRLFLSLDGTKETYEFMRGRDGHDKVLQVVEACKDLVSVSFMFTYSPYNSMEDMRYVVDLAEKYKVDVRVGIYNNIDYFDTTDKAHEKKALELISAKIPENVAQTQENIDFLYLYDEWLQGNLQLKCYSIFDSLVIHPDGNVPICQNLDISLGNVNEKSLDEIFNSRKTRKIQRQYACSCNGCWINFHRKYDIVLLRTLERFFPKTLIEIFYGKYQWTDDKRMTYKKLMQQKTTK